MKFRKVISIIALSTIVFSSFLHAFAHPSSVSSLFDGETRKDGLKAELNSKIVFSCLTHGNYDRFRLPGNVMFTMDDVDTLTAANLKLVLLGCCRCGYGGALYDNIVNAFYDKGVEVVIGFKDDIVVGHANLWVETFMVQIAGGATIASARDTADNEVMDQYNLPSSQFINTGIGKQLIQGPTSFIPCP